MDSTVSKVKQPERPKLIEIMEANHGASNDDPSGIAAYSQVGAQFGYGLGWTLIITYPLMSAIQEISAGIGWRHRSRHRGRLTSILSGMPA